MNPDFPFEVGDRVTSIDVRPGTSVTITAIGDRNFLARDDEGHEGVHALLPYGSGSGNRWKLVPPPIPRYTVEIRPAQPGERYVTQDTLFYRGFGNDGIRVHTNDHEAATTYKAIVIVDETEVQP